MNLGPLLALPVLLPLVLLQSTYFSYIPIAGVAVQMAVVVTLAFALWRDSAESAVWAFVAGLLIDLTSIAPLGSTAFALTIAVLIINPFRNSLNYSRVFLPLVLSAACYLIFQLVSLAIYRFTGYPVGADTIAMLPASVIVHALLVTPIFWLLGAIGSMQRRPNQINL